MKSKFVQKMISGVLVASFAIGMLIGATSQNAHASANINIGEEVTLAGHRWRCAEVYSNYAVLQAEELLGEGLYPDQYGISEGGNIGDLLDDEQLAKKLSAVEYKNASYGKGLYLPNKYRIFHNGPIATSYLGPSGTTNKDRIEIIEADNNHWYACSQYTPTERAYLKAFDIATYSRLHSAAELPPSTVQNDEWPDIYSIFLGGGYNEGANLSLAGIDEKSCRLVLRSINSVLQRQRKIDTMNYDKAHGLTSQELEFFDFDMFLTPNAYQDKYYYCPSFNVDLSKIEINGNNEIKMKALEKSPQEVSFSKQEKLYKEGEKIEGSDFVCIWKDLDGNPIPRQNITIKFRPGWSEDNVPWSDSFTVIKNCTIDKGTGMGSSFMVKVIAHYNGNNYEFEKNFVARVKSEEPVLLNHPNVKCLKTYKEGDIISKDDFLVTWDDSEGNTYQIDPKDVYLHQRFNNKDYAYDKLKVAANYTSREFRYFRYEVYARKEYNGKIYERPCGFEIKLADGKWDQNNDPSFTEPTPYSNATLINRPIAKCSKTYTEGDIILKDDFSITWDDSEGNTLNILPKEFHFVKDGQQYDQLTVSKDENDMFDYKIVVNKTYNDVKSSAEIPYHINIKTSSDVENPTADADKPKEDEKGKIPGSGQTDVCIISDISNEELDPDQLQVSVPQKLLFATKGNTNELIGTYSADNKLKNDGVNKVQFISAKLNAEDDWEFVSDATKESADNKVDFTITAERGDKTITPTTMTAFEMLSKKDLSTDENYKLNSKNKTDGSNYTELISSGHVSSFSGNVSTETKIGDISWKVKVIH